MSAAANSPCPTALRAAGSFSRRRWLVGLLLASIINSPAGPVDGITETPLAPRSGSHGATLFTELPPAQTGVVATNDYSDPKMWWELNHEFENGAIGTGVAIGDYDGDGRPDIFVVSKKAAGCSAIWATTISRTSPRRRAWATRAAPPESGSRA